MSAKILIVDDSQANLRALEAVLAPLSRKVVSATSGEEALLQVLSETFAVILMDVQMQGMDGFQTAAFIRRRERSREIPIIFVTGHDQAVTEAQRAYDVGAFDFITKPYDPNILRHKVGAFIRLHEQAEQLIAAQEAARLRDVLVGVLGHDLRNPVGAIAMSAALLEKATDIPERHRPKIDTISRAAQRTQQLINDMLDFTRGQLGGGIHIAPEDADLGEICRQAIDELQALHPLHSISIDVRRDVAGRWDPGRMSQVVSNLVGNAVQHAGATPIEVVVDGVATEAVRLTVANTGVIRPEVIPRLFEPFQRGDTTNPAGLGLGLYIVREVVRSHSGRVELRSDATPTEQSSS